MNPDDAIVLVCAGGGGYGDPLERDPARALRDVEAGLVSERVASGIYGVALQATGGGRVLDGAATGELRRTLRKQRLHEGVPAYSGLPGTEESEVAETSRVQLRVGAAANLVLRAGRRQYVCQKCGHTLAMAGEDPKQGALAREVSMESLSPWNRYGDAGQIMVRELCCPACSHLLAVEVRKRGDPILYDTLLR